MCNEKNVKEKVGDDMKVAVMGAGGVGAYFGGRLAEGGIPVSFIARGEHLKAMNENGLKINSIHGDFEIQVEATDDPNDIGTVDLVLFTVKAHDTEEAGKQISPLVGENTAILSLQNGIDNEKILSRIHGGERVVGGVAYILSRVVEPGVISHESLGRIEIGEMDGETTERLREIKEVFENSGVRCDILTNIKKVLWRKLSFNCALNAMTAITRSPLDEIVEVEESSDIFESAIREAIGVGIAEGVDMDEDEIVRALMKVTEEAGSIGSSMLHDLRREKRLEIDPINGKIVKLGRKHDIWTPINRTLYGCLKVINQNLSGQNLKN